MPKKYSGVERREWPRMKDNMPVTLTPLENNCKKKYDCVTEDLSAMGMCVRVKLVEGEWLSLSEERVHHVSIEGSIPGSDKTFKAIGRTVWVDRNVESSSEMTEWILAVKFEEVSATLGDLINKTDRDISASVTN